MKDVKRKSVGTHFSMCVQPAFIVGTNNEDGTYDAYISTGTCSGDQYSKISSDEIGENITDLIECLYEE